MTLGGDTVDEPYLAGVHHAHHAAHAAHHVPHHAAERVITPADAHLLHDHAAHHDALENAVVAHGIGEVRLGPAVARPGHRPAGPMGPHALCGHGENDPAVTEHLVNKIG